MESTVLLSLHVDSSQSDTSWSGDFEKPGRIPLLPVPNRPKPEQRPSSGKDPLEPLQPAENKLMATMTLLLEAWRNHSTGLPWRGRLPKSIHSCQMDIER
jgi:hypothetical protein